MPEYFAFLIAAIVLMVVPGPAVMFIVARALERGAKAGAVSSLGVATGGIFHVVFTGLGISATIMASSNALVLIQWAGAGYLVFLGVSAIRGKAVVDPCGEGLTVDYRRVFRQGVVVQVLNPKVAIFFVAFLPQFVDPARGSVLIQTLALGAVFVSIGLITDLTYAILAGTVRDLAVRTDRVRPELRWISAIIYVSLGVYAAASSSRWSK